MKITRYGIWQAAIAGSLAGALGVLGTSTAASAAPQASPVQRLRAACVRRETFGIDKNTYRCVVQQSRHTCHVHQLAAPCFLFIGNSHRTWISVSGVAVTG
jgi:hypothetical protein